MATYFVSFTIDQDTVNGRDYPERWTDLYDAIHIISAAYWQDTTSFIAFESDKTISEVTVVVKGAIEPRVDTALIRSMDSRDARIVGVVSDDDIFTIMPYLKRG